MSIGPRQGPLQSTLLTCKPFRVAHHGLLRKNGIALFVIGNTEYSGVHIENAEHLTESLLRSGFSRVRIAKRRMSGKILTPYRDYLGQFSRSATGRQVYREEFVIAATR